VRAACGSVSPSAAASSSPRGPGSSGAEVWQLDGLQGGDGLEVTQVSGGVGYQNCRNAPPRRALAR
jgi:hypothetical protein